MKIPISVSAVCLEHEVWIRVDGRGNFQGSACIRQFVHAMIQRGHREFVVDLAACEHMDSTFMGTLTGISQNLRELGQGSLRTINVGIRNVELLENLGLNHLFVVEPAAGERVTPAGKDVEFMALPVEVGSDKEVILAAHEALVAANPSNEERFRDVLEYLKAR